MNPPEKEHFLKIYRDMLEFKDGFDDGLGREYAEYRAYVEHEQEEYELGNRQGWENMQTFSEFFLDLIRPIYKKIDDWLGGLPAAQQKEEILTLSVQINYYIGLSEKYILTKHVSKVINGIKKHSTTKVSLNKAYPVVKKSLEIISERLAKYLHEELPVLGADSSSGKNKEFTTTTEILALAPDSNQGINKFNGIPIKKVREHFLELTTKPSKKGGVPFLTKEQFEQFIASAFSGSPNPLQQKISINFATGEKRFIRYLFYQFYELSKKDYESTDHVKDKYVRLLTDNFEGFSHKSIFGNFNKK